MDAVDWRILADAMAFYAARGFMPVELPWIQSGEVLMATCPSEAHVVAVPTLGKGLGLVGSAEQSFIAADMAGTLGRGRFVACTPCFRTEVVDRLHRTGFMKVELYVNDAPLDPSLPSELAELAASFMERAVGIRPEALATDEGLDLEIAGIEVGSYGAREALGIAWAYGTGAAEPRLTTAARIARAA